MTLTKESPNKAHCMNGTPRKRVQKGALDLSVPRSGEVAGHRLLAVLAVGWGGSEWVGGCGGGRKRRGAQWIAH